LTIVIVILSRFSALNDSDLSEQTVDQTFDGVADREWQEVKVYKGNGGLPTRKQTRAVD
jgi:hypothetical protein